MTLSWLDGLDPNTQIAHRTIFTEPPRNIGEPASQMLRMRNAICRLFELLAQTRPCDQSLTGGKRPRKKSRKALRHRS